jgi:hypothetical protein
MLLMCKGRFRAALRPEADLRPTCQLVSRALERIDGTQYGRQLLREGEARHSERVLIGWLHEIVGPGQAAARAVCRLPGRRQLQSPPMHC